MILPPFYQRRSTITPTQNTSSKKSKSRAQNQPWAWWLQQYEAWKSSGLAKAEFCTVNKINPSSFYNWVSKLEKRKAAATKTEPDQSASSAFIPAQIIGTESISQASALSCGDITLQFGEGLSLDTLEARQRLVFKAV